MDMADRYYDEAKGPKPNIRNGRRSLLEWGGGDPLDWIPDEWFEEVKEASNAL